MNDRRKIEDSIILQGKPAPPDGREMEHDSSNAAGVPFIGISRLRLGVDGKGVTTLAAFHGCELRCKYCLNPQCFGPADGLPRYTPESLFAELKKDDVYFRATGGGVTFGGGEPCLQADFIVRFREICGLDWKINVETSLNVDCALVEKLVPVVDEWIVDVKAGSHAKYLRYTGMGKQPVIDNLDYLLHAANISNERILLRIPIIPGFVDTVGAESTRRRFEIEGFTRFDVFTYRTEPTDNESTPVNGVEFGKAKCQILRKLREEIAAQIGCESLPSHQCNHEGDCIGTCPLCEYEVEMLNRAIRQFGNRSLSVSGELKQRINLFGQNTNDIDVGEDMGDIAEPPELGGIIAHPPEEVYKKIFFKECAIAGLSFHVERDDDLWYELEVGTKLALVRDRNNKHDRNAVAIALADDYDGAPDDFDFDYILGYIPRTENAEIAAMMDAGYADKFSSEITTFKQYGSYNDRIRVTIYIESREPIVPRPDWLRAEYLDDNGYNNMIAELKERGFATFRWGGFPPEERNLPEAGDKIVMLHEDGESVILHLMHILMTGEDCLKLGLDEDDIFLVDDCVHFALTNVIGPITMSRTDLKFLNHSDLQDYSATAYLTTEESDAIKEFFGLIPSIRP